MLEMAKFTPKPPENENTEDMTILNNNTGQAELVYSSTQDI